MQTTIKKSWSRLNAAEKRIALAKDVIKQLNAEKLIAKSSNGYAKLKIPGIFSYQEKSFENKIQLQTLLKEDDKIKCTVCGIGSIFICDIMNRDKYSISHSGELSRVDDEDIYLRLKIFPILQLNLIETAFEKRVVNDRTDKLNSYEFKNIYSLNFIPTKLGKRAIDFGRKFKRDKDRLIAIMENIIKNKGEFKP